MNWVGRLWHRRKLEDQLERELGFHLDERAAELVEGGYDAAEARRMARMELGGPEIVKEECRDARGTRWVEDAWQDVRYAARMLRQNGGFTAVALASLALGTGATTILYSMIDGVMLRPYAYRDPGRLVRMLEQTTWSTPQGNLWMFLYPNYVDCKKDARTLDLAVWNLHSGTLSGPGAAEYLDGMDVSADLFPLLGVKVAMGRGFRPEEDEPGGKPAAIVSYELWQRHFGGSREALGAALTFDGQPYTVVGVMPAGFRMEDDRFDVFLPFGPTVTPRMANRETSRRVHVWGRLRPGVTPAQSASELAVIGRRLEAAYPKANHGRTFVAQPLRPILDGTDTMLWLLVGAVTLVLLIGCANIASLLVARAAARERELAMRMALGATRWRLARQCLTESAVLALGGGALGVVLAAVGMRPFARLWPGGLPRVQEVQLNWHVLLFALGVSLTSGLIFGLAPALRAPARRLEQSLRTGARTVAGGSHRLHGAFVTAEIGIAVVLLVAAGLLGRTMLRLSALDAGMDVHNVLAARTALAPSTLADVGRTRAAWDYLLEQARRVPGIKAIAMVDTVPMREGSNAINYSLRAGELGYDTEHPVVLANSVTPDYLKVTGIPLRRGRFLAEQDRQGQPLVVVIDEVMAREAFAGQDPIGKQVWLGMCAEKDCPPMTVVGVVGHVRQWGLAADDQSKIRAQLYYPFAQVPDAYVRRWSELMSIAVRTSVDPLSVVGQLRAQVRGATGDQVLYEVQTLEQLASASLARQKFLLLLLGIFAGLALLLASMGIYGVLAYLTNRRTPEIGVRMALGATGRSVMWMVLRQSLAMIAAGVAAGSVGAWFATRYEARWVDGVRAVEPGTFAGMIAVLVAAALAASFLPARRASRVDPIRALRAE